MGATDRMPEPSGPPKPRVLVFGTADLSKPRVRLLLEGLRLEGNETVDCTRNIWSGVSDKSQVRSKLSMIGLALNWIWSMLVLSLRYLAAPKHDVVLVCYPGHLDLWFIRPLAWLRRKPVIWDAFLSAYDTIVLDRKMAKPGSLMARLAYSLDWCACRLCDRLFLDTPSHAAFFSKTFHISENKVGSVPVGAEDTFTAPQTDRALAAIPFKVLFYGQLIPLHGIQTILKAAELLEGTGVQISLVGRGQQSVLVKDWQSKNASTVLQSTDWVPYAALPSFIAAHHICLGIFSAGDKANRVVPNKIYQVVAMGQPVITRTSDAMSDFVGANTEGFFFVPPEDPEALGAAILEAKAAFQKGSLPRPSPDLVCLSDKVGAALTTELSSVAKSR